MNLLQLTMAVAVIGLGLHVICAGWRGEPPPHVSIGLLALVMMTFGLVDDHAVIAAISGLHAGWQFACAYMIHAGRPHVVRVHLYLDEETGEWVQSVHPSQHGESGTWADGEHGDF